MTATVLDRARSLLVGTAGLMARDASHAAVMLDESLDGIYSYHRDFDRIQGIKRLQPGK